MMPGGLLLAAMFLHLATVPVVIYGCTLQVRGQERAGTVLVLGTMILATLPLLTYALVYGGAS